TYCMDHFKGVPCTEHLAVILAPGQNFPVQLDSHLDPSKAELYEQLGDCRRFRYQDRRPVDNNFHHFPCAAGCSHDHTRAAIIAQASTPQPARNITPPMGVMAPSQRMPLRLNT